MKSGQAGHNTQPVAIPQPKTGSLKTAHADTNCYRCAKHAQSDWTAAQTQYATKNEQAV